MSTDKRSELAVNGGSKVRQEPFPGRGLFGPEEKEAVNAMFDASIESGNAFGYNGVQEQEYCKEFADYMGGGFADAVNSGTTAVYVALKALKLPPYSEVIVGCVTDPGGLMPVPMLNLIPVIADSAPGRYNTGAEQIEPLISPLTSAILVAHIAGEPVEMEGIMALAKKHGLRVVEDCAQAHGTRLNGKRAGTFGDVAAFSTMFGKHHCSGGQGGLVYTKDEDLYWSIRRSSDRGKPFGLEAGSTNCIASLNFNMDELHAAIGRVQLKKLPGIMEKRRALVAKLGEGMNSLKAVSLPSQIDGAEPGYWFVRTRFHSDALSCDKETFCQAVTAEGLAVPVNYRAALPHTMDWFVNKSVFGDSKLPWSSPEYKGDPNREFPCPNVNESMDDHFHIPVHEGWGDKEIEDVLTILRKVEKAFE